MDRVVVCQRSLLITALALRRDVTSWKMVSGCIVLMAFCAGRCPTNAKYREVGTTCQYIFYQFERFSINLIPMDALDQKIINSLAQDARIPLTQIAKELDVATATVHARVKRLREDGVIRGSRILLDWSKVELPVAAIISLGLGTAESLAAVAEQLRAIPYIVSCFAVTGEFDLQVVVRAHSSEHLGQVLEDIRHIAPGMSRTVVALTTYFEGRVPPLADG